MNMARSIFRDAYAHSGWRVVTLLALLTASGLSDGIGMALLYPMIQAAGIAGTMGQNSGTLNALFTRAFADLGIEPNLVNVSILLVASFLVQGVLFTLQNWLMLDIQKRYIASWQKRLFSDFMSAEWPYFVAQKPGVLANSILVECVRVGAAFFAIIQLLVGVIIFAVYLAVAFAASWKLMVYLLASAAVLFGIVHPIRRATRRYGGELGAINAEVASNLHELLSGAKLIKTSAGEALANSLLSENIERLRTNLTWGAFLPATVRSVFEFGAMIIVISAIFYSVEVEHIGPANLLVLVALVARLLPRLMTVQIYHNMLNLSGPSFNILVELHGGFDAHRETARSVAIDKLDPATVLPGEIRGENLVMRYGDRAVLDHVSFSVPAGRVVGFVGPSGAGKTTLLDSILNLVAPAEGVITIGGRPLNDLNLEAWRKKIGYVSQETFLFHDTIANNVRWNQPDAPMAMVEAAGRAAGLDQIVASLPDGYDTIVGDRGAKLSGGQRQRISIARALLRQPALLVLDEATSALDSISEREMVSVLDSLRGRMSIIIVAHRFAAVRYADFIYVLENGRVVEEGTWEQLSEGQALFRKLMDAQILALSEDMEART